MSKLLINEQPLVFQATLAKKLGGSDKAIILQQIQYWLDKSQTVRDGHKWVYNTVKRWAEQFPWLAEKTVQRYLKQLEDMGLLVTANYNKTKFDRTKWYTIDYEILEQLSKDDGQSAKDDTKKGTESSNEDQDLSNANGLAVPTDGTESSNPKGTESHNQKGTGRGNLYHRLPETTHRLHTDNKKINKKSDSAKKAEPPYKQIIGYLNLKTNAHYKQNSIASKRLIKARWGEGYRLQDFKAVIDNQAFQWQGTKWWRYMRPSTLFSSKFDEYLNANNLDKQKNKNPTSAGFDQLPNSDGGLPDIRNIPDDELPF